ncbi:DUF2236 domain-containing protein, partial [Streptomyces sp. SID5785]|nr:DUF2236 domain-containing protein [Streptomyces sp. SID5785]
MENPSRRKVLSLGVALGVVGAGTATGAWAWPASASVAGTGTGTDPAYVWDDEVDRLLVSLIESGQVPAVNAAMASWVDNDDPLPAGLPPELSTYLRGVNRLPDWA